MRTWWFILMMALAAPMAACSGDDDDDAAGGEGEGEGEGDEGEGEEGEGEGVSCHDCACLHQAGGSPEGCAHVCDMNRSGSSTPSFCNDAPALSQCEECILSTCGAVSAECN